RGSPGRASWPDNASLNLLLNLYRKCLNLQPLVTRNLGPWDHSRKSRRTPLPPLREQAPPPLWRRPQGLMPPRLLHLRRPPPGPPPPGPPSPPGTPGKTSTDDRSHNATATAPRWDPE